MKKLMIAAAVASMAIYAHALSCSWGSGAYAWGQNGEISNYDSGDAVGNYWMIALGSTSLSDYAISTDGKLVISDGTGGWTETGLANTGTYSAYALSGEISGLTQSNNGDKYGLIIYDTNVGAWGASQELVLSGLKDSPPTPADPLTFYNYIDADWENNKEMFAGNALVNVPEPTSGLLLLLGVAGLALRRRRA